jgi:prepilin-type N-terminal cleavage/methylation domain-containing protein
MKTSIPPINRTAPGVSGAFTLIELLVVITIIAILAGVAMPVYQTALMAAHMNAAVQNARQIGLALRACSNDLGGAYPAGTNSYGQDIKTANDAFRSLIPTYIDNEKVFTVPGSKDGPSADNKIDPVTEILKPGENHYAYISGLSTTSNSNYPLIADGTNDHGKYTNLEDDLGGVWKGTKAVVINVDSSAHLVPLLGTGSDRYIPRFDDPTQDALQVSYMGSAAQLLEPALN